MRALDTVLCCIKENKLLVLKFQKLQKQHKYEKPTEGHITYPRISVRVILKPLCKEMGDTGCACRRRWRGLMYLSTQILALPSTGAHFLMLYLGSGFPCLRYYELLKSTLQKLGSNPRTAV